MKELRPGLVALRAHRHLKVDPVLFVVAFDASCSMMDVISKKETPRCLVGRRCFPSLSPEGISQVLSSPGTLVSGPTPLEW